MHWVLRVSWNPSPIAVGGGFRLGDDLELIQLYQFYGLSSIGIGQVDSGFYGCLFGFLMRQSSVHRSSIRSRLVLGSQWRFLVGFGLSSVSWLTDWIG
jgi:hypothetical protein